MASPKRIRQRQAKSDHLFRKGVIDKHKMKDLIQELYDAEGMEVDRG